MKLRDLIFETSSKRPDREHAKQLLLNAIKAASGALALACLIGIATDIGYNRYSVKSNDAIDNDTDTKYEEAGEIQTPEIIKDLEFVDLETSIGNKLTSKSVKELSQSTIREIEELYGYCDRTIPPVLEWQRLASLFYAENTCMTVDPKVDEFVGIGQMGVGATKMAIKRANMMYDLMLQKGNNANVDNYIINNIMCNGSDEEINYHASCLWEQAKTDAKMCSALSALYLADLSGRNYTRYGENVDAIVMLYNVGEKDFRSFIEKGLIEFAPDKQTIYVDLSKVELLTKDELKSWNEGITYLIRVNGGHVLSKNDPNADILDIFEMHRMNVGRNDNYNHGEPNMKQYDYAPSSVIINGRDMDDSRVK